eukprot:13580980-Alexandrium_andersonii.AAC.1
MSLHWVRRRIACGPVLVRHQRSRRLFKGSSTTVDCSKLEHDMMTRIVSGWLLGKLRRLHSSVSDDESGNLNTCGWNRPLFGTIATSLGARRSCAP